jgi:hypothetical protein
MPAKRAASLRNFVIMGANDFTQLSLTPLGPGDLIDRAIRLYRRHFVTLLRIAAPPTLVTALGSVFLNVGFREAGLASSGASLALYVALLGGGLVIWVTGLLLNLVVMGGASRNLVTHILWGEAVSARATYSNVRARFWSLLWAAFVVLIGLSVASSVATVVFYLGIFVIALAAIATVQISPYLAVIVAVVSAVIFLLAALAVFFWLAGKLAYVPQVMLIEGKGVGAALSRSISLAKGNFKRVMALILFSFFATYSALMILIIPLGWYGYLNGVDPFQLSQTDWPAWYSIGYTVLSQLSAILLAPVWMLGLSLMYVDARVRHEGYDIELMAARQLSEMPSLPASVSNYYNPAVVAARGNVTPAPAYAAPPPDNAANQPAAGSLLGLQ